MVDLCLGKGRFGELWINLYLSVFRMSADTITGGFQVVSVDKIKYESSGFHWLQSWMNLEAFIRCN